MSAASPTAALSAAGVSIWLDDLSRSRIVSGGLADLIAERNVVGVTTNPTIFAAALTDGDAYREQVAQLAREGAGADAVTRITTADVSQAADILRPVYDATAGHDGWVSIEVGANSAYDTEATLREVHQLAKMTNKPNVFIKIPATEPGLAAIQASIAEGISVNVTLIFSLERYRAVIDAYLGGLEQALAAGRDLSRIHSVASFFVSRVDVEVDRRLDALGTERARAVRGEAGIANARLAYEIYLEMLAGERMRKLAAAGATAQRPLWASTGVKDPSMPDTRYVTELAAESVVNTMPEKTLQALADHGVVHGDTITGTFDASRGVLTELAALGIDFDEVTATLEREGVEKFVASGKQLTATLQQALDAAN